MGAHEVRKSAADETRVHCSGAREVEVREITGALACDIHLLNPKSKAKCPFEAAG